MKSLQGSLILDGGKLAGSEFHRTVVLICQHDPEGAFGLVLNRRSETKIADVLTETLPDAVGDLPLYLGGPVRPQVLSCLIHEPAPDPPVENLVLPGLRLAHSLEELVSPSGEWPAQAQFKFFVGYAGWGPGQLDHEMQAHAWLTHPASIEHVFQPRSELLWKSIVRTKGPEYLLLAEAPDDLSLN